MLQGGPITASLQCTVAYQPCKSKQSAITSEQWWLRNKKTASIPPAGLFFRVMEVCHPAAVNLRFVRPSSGGLGDSRCSYLSANGAGYRNISHSPSLLGSSSRRQEEVRSSPLSLVPAAHGPDEALQQRQADKLQGFNKALCIGDNPSALSDRRGSAVYCDAAGCLPLRSSVRWTRRWAWEEGNINQLHKNWKRGGENKQRVMLLTSL